MRHNSKPIAKSNTISVIKGIGIFLVVLGHTGMPLTKHIYLFHMALFFLLSGYTLKKKIGRILKAFDNMLLKRFKNCICHMSVSILSSVY